MSEWEVVWRIDVEADNPIEAARLAQEYQRDPSAIVGVFEVHRYGGARNERNVKVDLDAIDGKGIT